MHTYSFDRIFELVSDAQIALKPPTQVRSGGTLVFGTPDGAVRVHRLLDAKKSKNEGFCKQKNIVNGSREKQMIEIIKGNREHM